MPAAIAAWMVAMLSARSLGPYMPDMPMQPRPTIETFGPVLPSLRVIMPCLRSIGCYRNAKNESSGV